jgi:hypothetical protein
MQIGLKRALKHNLRTNDALCYQVAYTDALEAAGKQLTRCASGNTGFSAGRQSSLQRVSAPPFS